MGEPSDLTPSLLSEIRDDLRELRREFRTGSDDQRTFRQEQLAFNREQLASNREQLEFNADQRAFNHAALGRFEAIENTLREAVEQLVMLDRGVKVAIEHRRIVDDRLEDHEQRIHSLEAKVTD